METNEELVDKPEGEESPEQKNDKTTKKYLTIMETVKKVVGGENRLKPVKQVSGDETASIVAELFAEETMELRKSVKEGLKNLLKQHVQLEAEVAKKRKELDDMQLAKRKEFTAAANQWLQKVNQQDINNASYATALEVAFKEEEEKGKKEENKTE